MKDQLNNLPLIAFDWFLGELETAPFCHVEPTGRAKGMVYLSEGERFRLPTGAGIYVVYPKEENVPVYAGEGSNLRQRVEYHFSESKSAKKFSTLKKKLLKKGFKIDAPTHELVRFKFVAVPFGRKEIEGLFHAKHGINTKERAGGSALL